MSHSTSHRSVRGPGTAGQRLRGIVSYLIAGACLFWVFHDIRPEQLWGGLTPVHGWALAGCILLEFLAYLCVAWEWQVLLRPAGTLPLGRAAQAVFAGRFANDALPLQLGYLVRALLAARWLRVNVVSIFPSLIVERLWDGLWLTLGIGVVTLCLPLPPNVVRAADLLGVMVLVGTAATLFVVLRRQGPAADDSLPRRRAGRAGARVRLVFGRLSDGVRAIGRSGVLAASLGLALLKLGIQALAFLGLLWAYGLSLPLPVGLAVFLVGYLGICIPSTPAGTGMFQLFVVAGLKLFGVGKTAAAGFALAAFLAITVPLAVAGFFALGQSGLRLRQVRRQAVRSIPPA